MHTNMTLEQNERELQELQGLQSWEDQIIAEIDCWLDQIPFTEYCNVIGKSIIGQPNLSILLTNIYNYLSNLRDGRPINHNTILTAPSGSGKTETYRALKQYFNQYIPSLPVYIQDLTRLTPTGYKGMDPVDILTPFTKQPIQTAMGIVFLDEFDKKLLPSFNGMGDDSNKEVQNCLLTLVEGGMVMSRNNREIDTSQLMFIGLGSFNNFREKEKEKHKPMGFLTQPVSEYDLYFKITKKHMVLAGGSSELIGRFPITISYQSLGEESIRKVIEKTKQNIERTFCCVIELKEPMENYLLEQANGDFGCRMIESILREESLQQYSQALLCKETSHRLVITFQDKGDVSYRWLGPSKEEQQDQKTLELIETTVQIPLVREHNYTQPYITIHKQI